MMNVISYFKDSFLNEFLSFSLQKKLGGTNSTYQRQQILKVTRAELEMPGWGVKMLCHV